ncbi:MAG TPA: GNAT family N-acetyltransferase [Solirubrobacteraceae bacterium]
MEHQTLTHPSVGATEPKRDSIAEVNSIFEQPWWLDAVAPGRWGAAVVRRGEKIVARLPYARRRRLGLTTIGQPPFTQTLGPWLAPMEGKYARRLETEKRLLGQLINQLPDFDFYRQSMSPALTNWLPFHWAGFAATVRYTYRIEDLCDLDRVKSEFQDHVRRGIRKAERAVEVDHDFPLEELLRLNEQTYARQGVRSPDSPALIRRLDAACAARGSRRIFGAVDAHGRVHAALYTVWDDGTCYALINARDAELQAHGSNTLLYWEAIRLAAEVSKVFDFEGSMLEPIEHYFRGFGGRQTPYFSISRAAMRARPVLAAWSTRQALGRLARSRTGTRPRGAVGSTEPGPAPDPPQ